MRHNRTEYYMPFNNQGGGDGGSPWGISHKSHQAALPSAVAQSHLNLMI